MMKNYYCETWNCLARVKEEDRLCEDCKEEQEGETE